MQIYYSVHRNSLFDMSDSVDSFPGAVFGALFLGQDLQVQLVGDGEG